MNATSRQSCITQVQHHAVVGRLVWSEICSYSFLQYKNYISQTSYIGFTVKKMGHDRAWSTEIFLPQAQVVGVREGCQL